MKNEYDDEHFFEEYAQMTRSRYGLSGAGEWHQLKEMFPPLREAECWIWAADMAGTVNMPWIREQRKFWELMRACA